MGRQIRKSKGKTMKPNFFVFCEGGGSLKLPISVTCVHNTVHLFRLFQEKAIRTYLFGI